MSLSLIHYLDKHEELKVFMIHVDPDWILSYFKVMMPLLKQIDNG